MNDPACVGGGVDVDYRPIRMSMRLYLGAWRLLSSPYWHGAGSNPVLPYRKFSKEVGGYDEKVVDRRGR